MTPEQFAAIQARADAAHLPADIGVEAGDYMVSADGYTIEYASGDILCHFPLDPSGEGDYEAYNSRQGEQINFARYANRDVRALLAEVKRLRTQTERQRLKIDSQTRSLESCAGRLGEAALVILAVKAWDEAEPYQSAETSRLLHNAYVNWHEALKQREAVNG